MSAARNLVVILVDQLRRLALGRGGDPSAATPRIDRLAAQGTWFDAACSSVPVCVPFRFTFMTGLTAQSRFVPDIEWRMSPAERTLADRFNEAGHETCYIGKWHLYGGHALLPGHSEVKANRTPVPRHHQGRWKHWRAFEIGNRHFDASYFVDGDPTPVPMHGYQSDVLTDVAIAWMDAHRARSGAPFCLVLSVEPPHPPYQAPPELERRWLDADIWLPPNFMSKLDRERLVPTVLPEFVERRIDRPADRELQLRQRRLYHAMVENLDANVGRLLDHLDATGLSRDTAVVLTADHGELGGAHSSHGKEEPYEESIGTPLIVRVPGGEAGRVVREPTCSEDLLPTLCGLCGVPAGPGLPGIDLTPAITGPDARLPRDGVLLGLVAELRHTMRFHVQTWRAIRTSRHLYSVLGGVDGGTPWQLYDLHTDPWQLSNLIADPAHRALAERLHAQLRALLVAESDHYVLAPAFGQPGLNLWR